MEFQSVIEKRRSVRKYDSSKKVSKEQIEELIQAAIYAPTWKNSQTGRYYVAYTDEAIAKVRGALPGFNANSSEGASAYIITTFVKDRSGYERDGSPTTELAHNEWGAYDLGLANENIVLKAEDMGLASLIMGIRNIDGLKSLFEIPDDQIIVSVISVGYPADEPKMPKRKNVADVAKFL